ncbi:uncharacterized protein ASPGLDRAFT_45925 [Aspergillus glaucus CBS 516.65]|uniref:Uncharacterized protein n=1 Tax=Aspergillus glaucus CBS 516.65 TaxID=1160497 RepID=A0A1L9VM19_ASPGL|nr:hypothetical protein ASPGLDRAFT_45925 [Aspergillus glaucus CBS 516.65]OJJ84969.1 hypothetical protein ASPGLDRAFT_45925 [Aspergillus glaucus CBS 516.65]
MHPEQTPILSLHSPEVIWSRYATPLPCRHESFSVVPKRPRPSLAHIPRTRTT